MMRFDLNPHDGEQGMEESVDGDYVLYADHEAEVKRLRDALDFIAAFASGYGDVCEIIARRARAAREPQ